MFFMKQPICYFIFIFSLILVSFQYNSDPSVTLSQDSFTILQIFPHNKATYTQGLFLSDKANILYESGGLYSKSTLPNSNTLQWSYFRKAQKLQTTLLKELHYAMTKYIN